MDKQTKLIILLGGMLVRVATMVWLSSYSIKDYKRIDALLTDIEKEYKEMKEMY